MENDNEMSVTAQCKTEFIMKRVKEDPRAVDMQWSLFISAAQSYRYDSVLRPFPPMFVSSDGDKEVKKLEQTMNKVPSVPKMNTSLKSLPTKTIDLIHWVLDSKPFTLKKLEKSQFSEIQQKTGHTTEVPSPNFIFEVIPNEMNEVRFEQLRNNRDVFFAYHGSRIENFHSILHNGLASHMNKTSMFGEGTYLSSELAVSMPFSPTGLTWDLSELGNKLGCVAVCEMIDDPSVKCQEKTGSENGATKKSRSRVAGSMGGDVPEKYYIVRNNDMIRVRYLLVYAEKPTSKQHMSGVQGSWFQQNKFIVMMSFYMLLLLAIGLANSKTFQYHIKRVFR